MPPIDLDAIRAQSVADAEHHRDWLAAREREQREYEEHDRLAGKSHLITEPASPDDSDLSEVKYTPGGWRKRTEVRNPTTTGSPDM